MPFPSPMHESEVAQSCLTPSNPMDCSPPGSSVRGIFQARVLEWGASVECSSLCYTVGPSWLSILNMVSRSHIALAFWSSWVRLATDSGLCSSITRWGVVSGFISVPKPPPSCPFSAWLSAHTLPCVHSSFPLFLILPLQISHTSTVPSFEDTQEKLNI